MIDRRHALALMGAALVAPLPAFAQTPTSLKDLAAVKGIRFGSEMNAASIDDPDVSAILLRECAVIVPGNELKSYTIRADTHPDSYDFAPGDRILAFCQAHGLAMRGHNLYWAKDQYTPKWLLTHDFGPKPKVAAEALLRDYIGKVCDHFGDRLVSWDVVNEAIDEKTGALRDTLFSRILGQDYLRIYFEAARDHLPHMQLVYNDYMSWGTDNVAHRKGVLDLLRWFRDHNMPVDALGIQGHIGTHQGAGKDIAGSASTPDFQQWEDFLRQVEALGYGMLVTEFDVNDRLVEGDIATRDAAVAEAARRYMDITLACTRISEFLCWGLDDRHSWLQKTRGRADGLPLRPTPYDDQFRPKPLRDAMAAAFRTAPSRKATLS
jgi:endo-1,4-beta-xylanase